MDNINSLKIGKASFSEFATFLREMDAKLRNDWHTTQKLFPVEDIICEYEDYSEIHFFSDLPDYGLNLNLDEIPEVTAQEIFNFIDKAPYGDMLYFARTFEDAKDGPDTILSIPWIDCESCWVSNNYERSEESL